MPGGFPSGGNDSFGGTLCLQMPFFSQSEAVLLFQPISWKPMGNITSLGTSVAISCPGPHFYRKASCTWPPPLGASLSLSLLLPSPWPTTPVSSPALFQWHSHAPFDKTQCPVTPWVSSLPTWDLPLSTGKLIHRQQGLPSFPGNTSPSPGVTRACLCQRLSN